MPTPPPEAWELLLLGMTVLVGAGVVLGTLRTGAPPMPTRPLVRDAMLARVPRDARVIHELGAGFGGLAIAAARSHPDAQVHAWERAWLPWLVARLRVALLDAGRVHIHRGDLLDAPHAQADAVLLYLHPAAMTCSRRDCGTVSDPEPPWCPTSFALPDWTPHAEELLPDAMRTKVLVHAGRGSPGAPPGGRRSGSIAPTRGAHGRSRDPVHRCRCLPGRAGRRHRPQLRPRRAESRYFIDLLIWLAGAVLCSWPLAGTNLADLVSNPGPSSLRCSSAGSVSRASGSRAGRVGGGGCRAATGPCAERLRRRTRWRPDPYAPATDRTGHERVDRVLVALVAPTSVWATWTGTLVIQDQRFRALGHHRWPDGADTDVEVEAWFDRAPVMATGARKELAKRILKHVDARYPGFIEPAEAVPAERCCTCLRHCGGLSGLRRIRRTGTAGLGPDGGAADTAGRDLSSLSERPRVPRGCAPRGGLGLAWARTRFEAGTTQTTDPGLPRPPALAAPEPRPCAAWRFFLHGTSPLQATLPATVGATSLFIGATLLGVVVGGVNLDVAGCSSRKIHRGTREGRIWTDHVGTARMPPACRR